jgi:hypothetical protein
MPGGGRTAYAGANWAGGRHFTGMLGAPGQHLEPIRSGLLRAGHGCRARDRGQGYRESDTVLMAGVCGHAPTDVVFTWAKAKKLLHIR